MGGEHCYRSIVLGGSLELRTWRAIEVVSAALCDLHAKVMERPHGTP